jgi:hypothetical protein
MDESRPGQIQGQEAPGEALIRSAATDARLEEVEEEPRGSLVLLLLFLAVMAGVWLYVYFLLLERQ